LTAGQLVKPVKLAFFCKYPEVINVVFEEYLNLMIEINQKKKQQPSTAKERIQEVRAKRTNMGRGIGGEKILRERPASVRYEFSFEDVKEMNKVEKPRPKSLALGPEFNFFENVNKDRKKLNDQFKADALALKNKQFNFEKKETANKPSDEKTKVSFNPDLKHNPLV